MEKELKEKKLAEYYAMASHFKQDKASFISKIKNTHEEVLDNYDNLLYETCQMNIKRNSIFSSLLGSFFSFGVIYKIEPSSLRKMYLVMGLAFFLPIYYTKINTPSKTQRKIEEYLYVKYTTPADPPPVKTS